MVSGATAKPKRAAKRATRRMRTGSSTNAGLTCRSNPRSRSAAPPKGSTGTGFPGVFYLKYHLYRNYFPLYALARYRNLAQDAREYRAMQFRPAEFRPRSGFRGEGSE